MKKSLLLLVIVALFFSCSNFMYYPSVANAPLLQSKDEVKISAGLKGYSGYLTAAYALTDNFALQAGSNFLSLKVKETEIDPDIPSDYFRNSNLNGEFGAGFYFPFADKFVAEIYAGGGLGYTGARNLSTNELTKRNFGKLYFQADVGFRSKYFNAGIAVKEVLVNVYHEATDGVNTGGQYVDSFFEPFAFISLGGDQHKLNIQAGLSYAHNNTISYAPVVVVLGYEYLFTLDMK